MHLNQALYNFSKRGQCSIVEHNIGLKYALLVTSNSHISTTLSHPLWKNVSDSKRYVLAVPMIIPFKVLKYFLVAKVIFFICLPVVTRSQTGKNVSLFRNLDPHNSRRFHKKKWWFVTGICLIWKLMEYTNDHSPDASKIHLRHFKHFKHFKRLTHFRINVFITEVEKWKKCI